MGLQMVALAPAVLLVAGACTVAAAPADTEAPSGDVISVSNEGGSREGHTPTGFAGMGTGLFAGDNLNPAFPDGIGVQIYLTFELPDGVTASDARVTSDALTVSGTPFEDLGPLLIEPVRYSSFGPELFDIEAVGEPVECSRPDATSIACDVNEAVGLAIAEALAEVQVRLRFEQPADSDGRQDLAMFFRTDSNTNEAGIFELELTPSD